MKPVNLLPGDAPVAAVEPGKPNLGMIGGAVAGFLAIVVVGGYFAMARVDSVKSEAAAANDRATQATQQTAAVRSQIESIGQPIVDSDRQLAQGAETVLVGAYAERHDFVMMARELQAIMEGTGGWYESVEAASASGPDVQESVTIVGYMRTKELVASFNERANATRTLANAETIGIESERLTDLDTKRPGIYFKFTMTADLVDTVAPSAGGVGGAPGDPTGTTVADGGRGGDGELRLSLEREPRDDAAPAAAAKKRAPAKPKNPFAVASSVAGRGGAS